MKSNYRNLVGIVILAGAMGLILPLVTAAQGQPILSPERQRILLDLSSTLAAKAEAARTPLFYTLLNNDTGVQGDLNRNPDIQLMGIDSRGVPKFYTIENLTAAESISTDEVWPGGSSGLNLTGINLPGQLAVWDGDGVLLTHQEFGGRVVYGDAPAGTHYHATHVAGTMVAAGFDPLAKGMSYEGLLDSYEWTDDNSEMAAAAANGLLVSNHSYGFVTGWRWYGDPDNYWIWYGDHTVSPTEDYGFGFYSSGAADWDAIAYNAPNYLICKSAGNDRNDFGPAPGEFYFYWNPLIDGWEWIDTPRDIDGGPDGYDSVSWNGTAKNILTVGAVNDIPGGWTAPGDVAMSTFSCWGPTDDGRIKPDIVANGVGLWGPLDYDDTYYASLNGTSMSSPNAAGSVNLLAMHYIATHGGVTATSSTMKALVIHGADEAGPDPGPDYMNGWGMMNTQSAAEIISHDAIVGNRIIEDSLADGTTQDRVFYCDGSGPVRVTLVWTDPAGTPPPLVVDNPTLMLVNDLDMRLTKLDDSAVFAPYILDPANPSAPAATGDNFRDNAEQIQVDAPAAGWYSVSLTHKGAISGLSQAFSMIQTGLQEIYYVSNAGNDLNPGTLSQPFATIQHGIDAVMGIGEVIVMPGAFPQGTVITMKSGVNLHGQSGDPADVLVTGFGFQFFGVDASSTVAGMTITNCSNVLGGAMRLEDSSPLITNCIMAFNQGAFGGALYLKQSSPQITSCTIVGNETSANGAVHSLDGSQPLISQTIISHTVGGVGVDAVDEFSVPTLECCDLFENELGDWVGFIAPQVDLTGNFSADPCFCDILGGDFTLSNDSYCMPDGHPWGCTDLVGAQDSGCPDGGCGGPVANFLATFDVGLQGTDATIRWNISSASESLQFRLVRTFDQVETVIPFSRNVDTFEALDIPLSPGAIGTVLYSLYFQSDGEWELLDEKAIELGEVPQAVQLTGVFPNPFNPSTTIEFAVDRTQRVVLAIYAMSGKRVVVLEDRIYAPGEHSSVWNGLDAAGRPTSAGTYLLRMESENRIENKKLMLLK